MSSQEPSWNLSFAATMPHGQSAQATTTETCQNLQNLHANTYPVKSFKRNRLHVVARCCARHCEGLLLCWSILPLQPYSRMPMNAYWCTWRVVGPNWPVQGMMMPGASQQRLRLGSYWVRLGRNGKNVFQHHGGESVNMCHLRALFKAHADHTCV